jgi:hypothetical protein
LQRKFPVGKSFQIAFELGRYVGGKSTGFGRTIHRNDLLRFHKLVHKRIFVDFHLGNPKIQKLLASGSLLVTAKWAIARPTVFFLLGFYWQAPLSWRL